jgi:predicted N-acetyltransferase YhbS
MADFDVRVAEPLDAERVRALLEASYPTLTREAYDVSTLSPEALALMTTAQPRLLASGTFYVAESDAGQIVGCGGWTAGRPADGYLEEGVGHIRHFACHPDWARRGVGRALYARCETTAREGGVRVFECHALLNAEPFYVRLGFARIERIDVRMRPGIVVPGLLMRKALA